MNRVTEGINSPVTDRQQFNLALLLTGLFHSQSLGEYLITVEKVGSSPQLPGVTRASDAPDPSHYAIPDNASASLAMLPFTVHQPGYFASR